MSYHSLTIIGHAGSEPEHQVTAGGKDYAYFPLYVNERYGENERTIRYKVKTWNQLGLIVKEHVQTGRLLVVEGTPSVEVWQGNDGRPRAQMVVTARTLRFLGPKPAEEEEEIPI